VKTRLLAVRAWRYIYEKTLTSRRRKEADDDCHLQDAHSKRHAGMAGDTRHIYRHDFE